MTWTRPSAHRLYATIDATWPAAYQSVQNGWTIRNGAGGGKRVSAATQVKPDADISVAEAAMRSLGQTPLFMLRDGDNALDAALDARGYDVIDPVVMFAAPTARLAPLDPRGLSAMHTDAPLARMAEIWAAGGIGPGRLRVMERPATATYLMARDGDDAAATAFAALDEDIAMLHALEVAPDHRRKGIGRHLTGAAASWAQDMGATTLALMTTTANTAACGLYTALGMEVAGHYHYRIATP